jgi:hypothetical protein
MLFTKFREELPTSVALMCGGGTVHSIISGLMQCSKQRRYSITSSASESTWFGTLRLIALAVFILITKGVARRNLERQIGGLLALENAGSQRSGTIKGFRRVRAI